MQSYSVCIYQLDQLANTYKVHYQGIDKTKLLLVHGVVLQGMLTTSSESMPMKTKHSSILYIEAYTTTFLSLICGKVN